MATENLGEPSAAFLRRVWYLAAWREELSPGGKLARTIAGTRVLFWSTSDGEVIAFEDRCPHRMVPLSAGRNEGDGIRCVYHGMKFGSQGCLENPHGPIVSTLRPRKFPVVSRHDVLWLWLGAPDEADPGSIPDLSFIASAPKHAIFKRHLPVAAGHQLLVDNILDLSHADFLHPDTLGGGSISAAKTSMKQDNDRIVSRWDMRDHASLPIFRLTMPTPDTVTEGFIEVIWYPSGVMTLENGAKPVGHPGHPGYHVMSCHVMTPADAANTHYFYAVARDFRTEDAAFNEHMAAGFYGAFAHEDKPVAEAQQAVMGGRDLMDLDPKMMACDRSAVTARRIFKRLLRAEQAGSRGETERPAEALGS